MANGLKTLRAFSVELLADAKELQLTVKEARLQSATCRKTAELARQQTAAALARAAAYRTKFRTWGTLDGH